MHLAPKSDERGLLVDLHLDYGIFFWGGIVLGGFDSFCIFMLFLCRFVLIFFYNVV